LKKWKWECVVSPSPNIPITGWWSKLSCGRREVEERRGQRRRRVSPREMKGVLPHPRRYGFVGRCCSRERQDLGEETRKGHQHRTAVQASAPRLLVCTRTLGVGRCSQYTAFCTACTNTLM